MRHPGLWPSRRPRPERLAFSSRSPGSIIRRTDRTAFSSRSSVTNPKNPEEPSSRSSPEEISKLEGRTETVVTVGSIDPRGRRLGLLFWILMAVGPAGISTRLRGELAENGGGAHMHREDTVVGAPRAPNREFAARTRCVCVRAVTSALSPRGRARTSVSTCARGWWVGRYVWTARSCTRTCASINTRCEFGVTWVIHPFRID